MLPQPGQYWWSLPMAPLLLMPKQSHSQGNDQSHYYATRIIL
jgi:hypothetical protein